MIYYRAVFPRAQTKYIADNYYRARRGQPRPDLSLRPSRHFVFPARAPALQRGRADALLLHN